MVNYANMPWKSKGAWQSAVQYKYGPDAWMWRDRAESPEIIKQVMQPCIRYTKEEVLKDLPPVTRTGRTATLTAEQEKHYNHMKHEMITMFKNGLVSEANQKGALLGKLFQICLGSVIAKGEPGSIVNSDAVVTIDSKPRLTLISDLIKESERKTVVFCNYVAAIEHLYEQLRKLGHSVAMVHGGIVGATRDRIFFNFQNEKEPNVLIAHPITTAYGTELAAADQIILNGPMMSGTHAYMQALARLSSTKQSAKQISIIEVSASAEEREFFQALHARMSYADAVGALFQKIVKEEI
jgi:hypothetical protein